MRNISYLTLAVLLITAAACAGADRADSWLPKAAIEITADDLIQGVPVTDGAPGQWFQGGTDVLVEETFGSWERLYSGANRDRGNIFRVDSTVNLYEHRLQLSPQVAMPMCFIVYQGPALVGNYNLIDSVTIDNIGPGTQIWCSSGVRNVQLDSGSYYYIGTAWLNTCGYACGNTVRPPFPASFGALITGNPATIAGYPPSPTCNNTRTDWYAYPQVIVTGNPTSPHAPQAPENFTVAHNQAQLRASLSWTNPDSTFGGAPLTDLDGVKIFRGEDSLTTMTNVQIGQQSSYDDNSVPATGMYDYHIIAFNDSGDSPAADASAWIGLDTPGPPSNITTNPDTLQCVIGWTAPAAGAHGGYWPAGSWTGQKVYRDGSEIADLPGTNTNYTDNPNYQGNYVYGVAYYNASGVGEIAEAPPVFVPGPPVYLWEAVNYDWVEINTIGANSGITGDDQNLGPYPLGFSFPFYPGAGPTEDFTDIRICSNGFLSFTSTSTAYNNTMIPTPGEPENLLALLWDDLNPSQGGTIWVYNDTQNDRWICEFENVLFYSAIGAATCEAIIYADGTIEFMYNNVQDYTSCTVGVENQDGSQGLELCFNGAGLWIPANQTGVRIYHPGGGPPLNVTLTPHNPPIVIPSGGGSFVFDAEIFNNSNDPQVFDGWTEVILPNGSTFGPLILRTGIPIAPGQTVMRIVSQTVPGNAPPGSYTYVGNAGTHPSVIIDTDNFTFAKLIGDAASAHNRGWEVEGWFGEGSFDPVSSGLPAEYSLTAASPNPFNPTTSISFALPKAGKALLTVFDITGREVAALVDGEIPAGRHSVVFDGSKLASGVYFYKLETEGFSAVKKMALVK